MRISSDREHDLPELRVAFHVAVRLGHLVQTGKHLRDDRLQFSGSEPIDDELLRARQTFASPVTSERT